MTSVASPSFRPIHWVDGAVSLIDQSLLPMEEVWLELNDYRDIVSAIKEMRIRGAPAIGVAGAYGVALAAQEMLKGGEEEFIPRLEQAAEQIETARPTGANLSWAVKRMMKVARRAGSAEDAVKDLIAEAARIHDEDEEANLKMGRLGAELIPPDSAVLTHCNAGALATGGYGTALGVIQTAWKDGKVEKVFATETRPLRQGARLTAWELMRAKMGATLISDSASGQLMRLGKVDVVVVGADRIAANGDVANKIGTYTLAVLANENSVPFYVAAPTSTIDLDLPSGDLIPIEERPDEELTHLGGVRATPDGIDVLNAAFDVTPSRYVTAIITESGVVRAPYSEELRRIVEAPVE